MLKPIILACSLDGTPCHPATDLSDVFKIERRVGTPGECWRVAALVLAQYSDFLNGMPYRVRCEHVGPLDGD